MMRKCGLAVVFVVIGMLMFGCVSHKEPAAAAIKAAEDALNAVKAEAVKYVPDQVQAVEGLIKGAKGSFEKGEYEAALNAAKGIPDKVKELAAAAAGKKAELTKNWEQMSAGLPKMLEAIKGRLDILAKSKKLPKGLDKATLEGAKGGYEAAAKAWADAQGAFASGELGGALAKAKEVKDKAAEVMKSLGMEVPEAAKG